MKLAELTRLMDEYRVLNALRYPNRWYVGNASELMLGEVTTALISSGCLVRGGIDLNDEFYIITDAGRQRLAELEALDIGNY